MPILSNMPGGMDTSDATATAADIISGKSAYANGIKVTGTYDVLEHMRDYCENGAHIELTATVGDNTLHLRTQTGGHDCVILWGDGAATRAPVNGGNVIHNYAEAGTYHIYIVGRSFAGFYVNNQTGKEKYTAVHSMGQWENDTMTNLDGCFRGCASLTKISADLFRYNTKVTGFESCFSSCSKLTAIPDGLFRNNTAVTSFIGCFYGCASLATLPAGLFQYNTSVTNFRSCFDACTSLTTIPADLFRYNTAVTGFRYCFDNCASLTTIPAGLFRYNTKVTDFSYCFFKCTSLTTIPADSFRYNASVTNFCGCFDNCTSLTTIPAGLFRYNTKVTDFSYCFFNCASLTTIPVDLFRYNMAVTDFYACFEICTKLSLRSDIFGADCANRFAGKTINFSNCFSRTSFSGTKGTAPQLWNFTFGSVTSAGCFGGSGNSATSLTNYADIPAAWK